MNNTVSKQIAQHIRDIHFGGNWTMSDLQHQLSDVTWQQAIQKVDDWNTIAALVYHMNFYLNIVKERLTGDIPVFNHDDSFAVPTISSEQDWQQLLQKSWQDAERFANAVENTDDEKLWKKISERYSTYYKNLQGVVEHNHYHLGQIILIKKLLNR